MCAAFVISLPIVWAMVANDHLIEALPVAEVTSSVCWAVLVALRAISCTVADISVSAVAAFCTWCSSTLVASAICRESWLTWWLEFCSSGRHPEFVDSRRP